MLDITRLRTKTLIALLMAFFALGTLAACSSTEEEDDYSDEICDEADAGTQGCPN